MTIRIPITRLDIAAALKANPRASPYSVDEATRMIQSGYPAHMVFRPSPPPYVPPAPMPALGPYGVYQRDIDARGDGLPSEDEGTEADDTTPEAPPAQEASVATEAATETQQPEPPAESPQDAAPEAALEKGIVGAEGAQGAWGIARKHAGPKASEAEVNRVKNQLLFLNPELGGTIKEGQGYLIPGKDTPESLEEAQKADKKWQAVQEQRRAADAKREATEQAAQNQGEINRVPASNGAATGPGSSSAGPQQSTALNPYSLSTGELNTANHLRKHLDQYGGPFGLPHPTLTWAMVQHIRAMDEIDELRRKLFPDAHSLTEYGTEADRRAIAARERFRNDFEAARGGIFPMAAVGLARARGANEDDVAKAREAGETITDLGGAMAMGPRPPGLVRASPSIKPNGFRDPILRMQDLAEQGHGPQRHGPDISVEQLKQRAVEGKDPITGTTIDGVWGGEHPYGRHATKFNSNEAYVRVQEYARDSDDFRNAVKTDSGKAHPDERVVLEIPLREIFGSDFRKHVSGVTRVGSKKNPQGHVDTVFPDDSKAIAIYDKIQGKWTLTTMYPNPE